MKFAEIIREAGCNPERFPECSQISITLYDRKQRKITSETIHFVEPLFQCSPVEYEKFDAYLTQLEKKLEEGTVIMPSMNVQITENAVVLNLYTAYVSFFFRHI